MIYTFYTDGSARKNGKIDSMGAWAFAQIENNMVVYSETDYAPNSTNQQMELIAMINACNYAKQHFDLVPVRDIVILYTDSAYIANCMKDRWYENWIKNGWYNSKKQPVANKELWKQLIPFFLNPCYEIRKTAGHASDEWNNYVDSLATTTSKEAQLNVSSSNSCL